MWPTLVLPRAKSLLRYSRLFPDHMRREHLTFSRYVLQLGILNLGERIGEVTTINPSSLTPILESQIRAEAGCYAIICHLLVWVYVSKNQYAPSLLQQKPFKPANVDPKIARQI